MHSFALLAFRTASSAIGLAIIPSTENQYMPIKKVRTTWWCDLFDSDTFQICLQSPQLACLLSRLAFWCSRAPDPVRCVYSEYILFGVVALLYHGTSVQEPRAPCPSKEIYEEMPKLLVVLHISEINLEHLLEQACIARDCGTAGVAIVPASPAANPQIVNASAKAVREFWPEACIVVNYLGDPAVVVSGIASVNCSIDAVWTDFGVGPPSNSKVSPDSFVNKKSAALRDFLAADQPGWQGAWWPGAWHKGDNSQGYFIFGAVAQWAPS